jgi:hypothetical protein
MQNKLSGRADLLAAMVAKVAGVLRVLWPGFFVCGD